MVRAPMGARFVTLLGLFAPKPAVLTRDDAMLDAARSIKVESINARNEVTRVALEMEQGRMSTVDAVALLRRAMEPLMLSAMDVQERLRERGAVKKRV